MSALQCAPPDLTLTDQNSSIGMSLHIKTAISPGPAFSTNFDSDPIQPTPNIQTRKQMMRLSVACMGRWVGSAQN